MPKRKKPEAEPDILKSWQQITAFLGQPVSVAQRWATEGMPVKREGRCVGSSREELLACTRISRGASSDSHEADKPKHQTQGRAVVRSKAEREETEEESRAGWTR